MNPPSPAPKNPPQKDDSGTAHWSKEFQRFIEAGGNTTHAFGLGRMIGRMYVALYLSPRPLPLEEIAERLYVSKASASTVVRQLAAWKAVRQVWMPGDRRDFYEAETNFSIVLREGLLPGVRKKFQSAEIQVGRTLQSMPPAGEPDHSEAMPYDKAEQQEIRRRLRSAQTFHKRLDRILSSRLIDHFL